MTVESLASEGLIQPGDTAPDHAASVPLCLNPALVVRPFDASGAAGSWLYELPDAKGRMQQQRISDALHQFLQSFIDARSMGEVRDALARQGASERAICDLMAGPLETCIASRILVPPGSVDTRAHEQPARPGYMSWMLTLLQPPAVRWIARPLQFLFSPVALAIGVLAIIAGLVMMALALRQSHAFGQLQSGDVLAMVAMAALGILLHELGHAAAAQRFGAREVRIGVGWYVCFPVAFASLSEAWAFPRLQRALIDVAGVHVQGLMIFVLMCVHQSYPHPALLLASVSLAASMLWNLNPFLRLDGYWLASDLLGIPNLREEGRARIARSWAALRGRRVPEQAGFALSARMGTALLVHAIASTVVFIWLVYAAARYFGAALMEVLPAYVDRLLGSQWTQLGWADIVVLVGAFAWQLFMVVLIGRFLQITLTRWSGRLFAMIRPVRG